MSPKQLLLAPALALALSAQGQDPGVRDLALNGQFETTENGQPVGYSPATVKGNLAFASAHDAQRRSCLQIRSDDPEAIGSWVTAAPIRVVPGDQLDVRVDVKLQDVDPVHAGSGAQFAFHFYQDERYLSFNQSRGSTGTHEWRELSHSLRVPKAANEVRVSMRLSQAKGTVWFDNLRVMGRPGAARATKRPEPPSGSRGKVALFQQRTHQDVDTIIGHFHHEKFAVDHFHAANIKTFPADPSALRQYTAIFYSSLATEGGVKLLSKAQQEAIAAYVRAGGGFCSVVGELPGSALGELLPIQCRKQVRGCHFIPVVKDAVHPILRDLPARWPGFGTKWNAYQEATLKPGAIAIMAVPEAVAPPDTPFLVVSPFGRGRVVCFNSLWCFGTGSEFKWWRYAPRFFGQCARWAGGRPALASKDKLPPPDWADVAGGGSFWAAGTDPSAMPKHLRDALQAKPTRPTKAVALVIDPAEPYPTKIATPAAPPRIEDVDGHLRIVLSNGFRIQFDKALCCIAVQTAKGLSLAATASDARPRITQSGAEPLQVFRNVDAETVNFQTAAPKRGALAKKLNYVSHEIDGASVIVRCGIDTVDGASADLYWTLTPRTIEINGNEWKGFGLAFRLVDDRHFIESIVDRTRWRVGEVLDGHHTMRAACYSQPRGFYQVRFEAGSQAHSGKWSYFSSGQPFQVVGAQPGTLFTYMDTPTTVMGWTETTPDRTALYMTHQIKLGRQRGEVSTPMEWRLFGEQPLTPNLWMELYDHVRQTYCKRYGIAPAQPVPSAMSRFDCVGQTGYIGLNAAIKPYDYRQMADVFVPAAARSGCKRVDIGHVIGHEISPTAFERNGGQAALRYLVDKAHSLGMEAYWYLRIAIYGENLKLFRDHPDWVVKSKDGSPYQGSFAGMNVLSMKSGWFDYSLNLYREWKRDYDMDGVWFDTVGFAFDPFDYAEPQASSMVPYGIRYLKAFQDIGYGYWVEGQSPLGLDSFWYRKSKYEGKYEGHEFALFNTSPWTQGPHGAFFIDLFKLASYHCCMVTDVRLMLDAGAPLTQRITECNRKFNRAVELVGHPLKVKQTDFGTLWIGEKGYALFAHKPRIVTVRGLGSIGQMEIVGHGKIRGEGNAVVAEMWREDVAIVGKKLR